MNQALNKFSFTSVQDISLLPFAVNVFFSSEKICGIQTTIKRPYLLEVPTFFISKAKIYRSL